jgi:hypothetical protein
MLAPDSLERGWISPTRPVRNFHCLSSLFSCTEQQRSEEGRWNWKQRHTAHKRRMPTVTHSGGILSKMEMNNYSMVQNRY